MHDVPKERVELRLRVPERGGELAAPIREDDRQAGHSDILELLERAQMHLDARALLPDQSQVRAKDTRRLTLRAHRLQEALACRLADPPKDVAKPISILDVQWPPKVDLDGMVRHEGQ